ncbi:MAG TPA: hypothetical protein VFZ17_13435, partial [Acidimicrobiia bacterium]|nr:hypothetical protein [Acidimicrobiia bacterium]
MSRARSLLDRFGPVTALALVAVAISLVVHHTVYPAFSWNRDEVVYLWQVQGLAEGKAFTSGGGMPLFFQPWLSGIHDGMYFSQYTLGWPLVLLAFDQVLGSATGALAFATALAVVGTYAFAREITRERSTALVAAGLLVLSPLLVIQSGVYLGYLFSLGLGALFGATLLAGLRLRRWWLLVVSGALVGWLFMTRPFDGLLWGVALVAYAVFAGWADKRALARGLGLAALGFLPLLVATLAYNHHITGSFTEFPITAADSSDTFGFGLRSIGERWTPTNFTALLGVKGIGRNGWELPPFLFGSYVAAALAAVGLWLRRRDRSTVALLAIALAFPIGYFAFWGISLSASFANLAGPIYFIPLFLPICILVATSLGAAWHRSRALTVGLVVVMVAATAPFLIDRIQQNHDISAAQTPWRTAESKFDDHALVIVERSGPYLLHLNPFSSNPPDLDGPILYATDRGPENLDLIARHPDRTPYFEATTLTAQQALLDYDVSESEVTVRPIVVERAPVLTIHARVTNRTDDPVVVASLTDGGNVDTKVLSTTASRGDTFDVEWHVQGGTPFRLPSGTIGLAGSGTLAIDV